MVDSDDKTWNTLFDLVLEWAPILKQVYEEQKTEDLKNRAIVVIYR